MQLSTLNCRFLGMCFCGFDFLFLGPLPLDGTAAEEEEEGPGSDVSDAATFSEDAQACRDDVGMSGCSTPLISDWLEDKVLLLFLFELLIAIATSFSKLVPTRNGKLSAKLSIDQLLSRYFLTSL